MSDKLNVRIVTPDGLFFEGPAAMVIFQSTAGELGILPGHVPVTAAIESTEFYFKTEMTEPQQCAKLGRGFVQVLPEGVTVVTQKAEWPEEA